MNIIQSEWKITANLKRKCKIFQQFVLYRLILFYVFIYCKCWALSRRFQNSNKNRKKQSRLNNANDEETATRTNTRTVGLQGHSKAIARCQIHDIFPKMSKELCLFWVISFLKLTQRMKGDDYEPILLAENQNQHSTWPSRSVLRSFYIDFTKTTFCASNCISSNVITNYNLGQVLHSSVELRQCIGQ